jgi:hypothetical protein
MCRQVIFPIEAQVLRRPIPVRESKIMSRPTVFLAILATLVSTPAFAQVKKWIDEKGTVHYEAPGPAQPKTKNLNQAKPSVRRPLDRNYAGLTLGDNEASFAAAQKGEYVGKSGPDANYYRYIRTLPEGAIDLGALFATGRLAFITIQYHDFGSEGWEQLITQTSEKYGPPTGDTRNAVWNDGITALSFRRDSSGNITIILEDFIVMSKYSEQEKAALPKF